MSGAVAGFTQAGLLILVLGVCYRPLGDYIARVVTDDRDWRAERAIYRTIGVDPAGSARLTRSRPPLPSCWSPMRGSLPAPTC